MKILLLTCGLTACLGITCLAGEPIVKVEKAWVRAVPPSSTDSAAYMTLVSNSDQDLRLTGASTPRAAMVLPMVTTKKTVNGEEVMGMKGVRALVIPAHGQLSLSPSGDHLMLMNLKGQPKAGEKVPLTLHIEPGAKELTIEVPVALHQP